MENQTDDLHRAVGNKPKAILTPKTVKIIDVVLEGAKKKNSEKEIGKVVTLSVKHPDKDESVIINKIKFIRGNSVTLSSLWYNLDGDGNIQMGSPVALLLNVAKAKNLLDLKGKEVMTDSQSADVNYLCVKAY